MSSLAGALEEPIRYHHSYSSALSFVAHDQDVDMETPEVKEEPDLIQGQVVVRQDGEDEPMDDLFGQEEMDEPRQVKSETCGSIFPRNMTPGAHTITLRMQEPCGNTCRIWV